MFSRLRLPFLSGFMLYCLIFLTCFTILSTAQRQARIDSNETAVICRPFGTCERCPDDELDFPFCQPFGNRRLMHCVPASSAVSGEQHGETPAWESCGRIVAVERADFWEFMLCNAVFCALALTVVVVRSKRLEALHARQLAARIGLVRGSR